MNSLFISVMLAVTAVIAIVGGLAACSLIMAWTNAKVKEINKQSGDSNEIKRS